VQQELIRMITEKTGLSEDKARLAAETVINYLKGKLPAAVSSQLDSVASGGAGNLGEVAGSVRSKFGM
jgi:hypothetical protein